MCQSVMKRYHEIFMVFMEIDRSFKMQDFLENEDIFQREAWYSWFTHDILLGRISKFWAQILPFHPETQALIANFNYRLLRSHLRKIKIHKCKNVNEQVRGIWGHEHFTSFVKTTTYYIKYWAQDNYQHNLSSNFKYTTKFTSVRFKNCTRWCYRIPSS